MASLIVKQMFKLQSIIAEPVYYLNQLSTRFVFVDKKRTDDIAGYVYTVTNTDTFDQINVFIEGTTPLLSAEELSDLQNTGKKVFVEFENATVKPYFSDRTKTVEDSIKADAIHIVENK